MTMSTPQRTTTLIALCLFIAFGLSIGDVQASQDGQGSGRGRGARVDNSEESQYFKICDHDKNHWISFREAGHSLLLDRDQFARVDIDSDGRITRPEFDTYYTETTERAGSFREPRRKAGIQRSATTTDAPTHGAPKEVKEKVNEQSVRTLFGEHHPRSVEDEAFPLPPQIRGPVNHFDRLDVTRDGNITIEDLEWLARPALLEVRFSSVIAILDADNDGGVSRAEFNAAML